jgi:hypothetical protein
MARQFNMGVWAGGHGGGGHVPPQNVHGRAKMNAKFGQNIKISEKFWNVLWKLLGKDVRKKFLICVAKLSYVSRKVFDMCENVFLVSPETFVECF